MPIELDYSDSPGVPPSATAHELFRGFSFVAPGLLDDCDIYTENKQSENVTTNFPTYVNTTCITDEYDFKQEIGKGSYSTVYLAVHKATKAEYAIKVSAIVFIQEFMLTVEVQLLCELIGTGGGC